MPSKSVIHSQRLHRDVVDAEVVTTLERRKREGNDSLQLTVALQVNGTILTNFVFEESAKRFEKLQMKCIGQTADIHSISQ